MAGNDAKTPEEVEREIEHHRKAMRETIHDLQDRVAPEELAHRAGALMRREGAALAEATLSRARRNPVAAAMVVAGLAWLMFGPDPDPPRRRGSPAPPRRRAGPPPGARAEAATAPRGPVPRGRPAPAASGAVHDGAPGQRRVHAARSR